MDNTILRKKLNTYKSAKGVLKGMSNDVVLEVLQAWQNWPGATADLYRDLELSKGQMSAVIRTGKKLVKNGVSLDSDFKELKIEGSSVSNTLNNDCEGIQLSWCEGRVIQFGQVDQLVDFLKKVS